jgi:UDP-N-acetylglucosamine 2-epimerase (non-hydrolysing)
VPLSGAERQIVVVFGTRPEAVKLRGVVHLLGPAARLVHTGQHYSTELAGAFQAELGIGTPIGQLSVGGSTRGRQIGEATIALEEHLEREPAAAVVVQGDTNSTLAGALAANATGTPLAHVEAGLRSRDRAMPEEHNRVLVDHLSDMCCAPTQVSESNLLAEGIAPERIDVTGNTVVDAVLELTPSGESLGSLLRARGLEPKQYVLATFHRPENVDDPDVLATILRELAALPLPVVLPLHPRTRRRIETAGLGSLLDGVRIEAPTGYATFLGLMSGSALVVSDSGGVQEESSVLKRPVVVVRQSTERPEVLGSFSALTPPGPGIGHEARRFLDDVSGHHARLAALATPYGDGHASERTVRAIERIARSG